MQRGALLGAGLGEGHGTRRELEAGQRDARRQLLATLKPAQPAGDHQVQHEKKLGFETDHDALAEAAHRVDPPALGGGERRHDGAQHERADQAHAVEPLARDASVETFDIDDDVGQLRHATAVRYANPNAPATAATPSIHSGCSRVESETRSVAPVIAYALHV